MEVQDDQLDHNADTAAPGANRTSVHMDHTFSMVIDNLYLYFKGDHRANNNTLLYDLALFCDNK